MKRTIFHFIFIFSFFSFSIPLVKGICIAYDSTDLENCIQSLVVSTNTANGTISLKSGLTFTIDNPSLQYNIRTALTINTTTDATPATLILNDLSEFGFFYSEGDNYNYTSTGTITIENVTLI